MAYGKIARLPPHIRDELNRRLNYGEMGIRLVEWLNTLPEVKEVLESEFDSRPISEQNLSEWKEHGYRHWRAQRESVALSRETIAYARDLAAQTGGELTESLATVVAARYADVLKKSQEEITDELRDELKVLKGIIAPRTPQMATPTVAPPKPSLTAPPPATPPHSPMLRSNARDIPLPKHGGPGPWQNSSAGLAY